MNIKYSDSHISRVEIKPQNKYGGGHLLKS